MKRTTFHGKRNKRRASSVPLICFSAMRDVLLNDTEKRPGVDQARAPEEQCGMQNIPQCTENVITGWGAMQRPRAIAAQKPLFRLLKLFKKPDQHHVLQAFHAQRLPLRHIALSCS